MWVMTSVRRGGEIHVYIGAVKVAEICFAPRNTKYKVFLRLMRNFVSYDVQSRHETVSAAFVELHKLLNSPGPEI